MSALDLLQLLGRHPGQGRGLVLAACVGAHLLRGRSAASRYAVWSAGLRRSLLLPARADPVAPGARPARDARADRPVRLWSAREPGDRPAAVRRASDVPAGWRCASAPACGTRIAAGRRRRHAGADLRASGRERRRRRGRSRARPRPGCSPSGCWARSSCWPSSDATSAGSPASPVAPRCSGEDRCTSSAARWPPSWAFAVRSAWPSAASWRCR